MSIRAILREGTTLAKSFVRNGKKVVNKAMQSTHNACPTIHNVPGEIARMQKPGKIVTESIPTQQYIDSMLQVGKYDSFVGIYNKQKAADALYAFTKGTKVQPVTTTSVNTAEAINSMHRVDYLDKLRRAEVTGELPSSILQKRNDFLAALESYNGERLGSPKFLKVFGERIGIKKPDPMMESNLREIIGTMNKTTLYKKLFG